MIQDRIVPIDQARISPHDRGLFFGDGVYEALRSYNGRIWAFEQHVQRLERSLKAIEIDNVDLQQVRQRVTTAFKQADIADAIVYFHITRGRAFRSHVNTEPLQPQFFLTVRHAPDTRRIAEEGVAAVTTPDLRWFRRDIKSLNLLPNVLARLKAQRAGAHEAIFVDDHGLVTEAAVSTVFAVFESTLQTHPLDRHILPGITRQAVLHLAETLGMAVREEPFTLQQARRADELLLAGTGEEVRSVVRLDGRAVGTGKPGPVTKKIIDRFHQLTLAGQDGEIPFRAPPVELWPTAGV